MRPKRLFRGTTANGSKSRPNYRAQKQQRVKRVASTRCPPKSSTTKETNLAGDQEYICSSCNQVIKEKYLLEACDKYWHEDCLKCDRCQAKLGELGSSLYSKGDMNLCRQDYLEIFGQTAVCSVCEKLIYASEMVMRARQNVYHLDCFACQLCGQRFCVGDRFYLFENKIVCQFDFEEHIVPLQKSLFERGDEPPSICFIQHQEGGQSLGVARTAGNSCGAQDGDLCAPNADSDKGTVGDYIQVGQKPIENQQFDDSRTIGALRDDCEQQKLRVVLQSGQPEQLDTPGEVAHDAIEVCAPLASKAKPHGAGQQTPKGSSPVAPSQDLAQPNRVGPAG